MSKKTIKEDITVEGVVEIKQPIVEPISDTFSIGELNVLRDKVNEVINKLNEIESK